MAVTIRSGAQGTGIMLGLQTAYGTPVSARAKMIPRFFPVSALSLDAQSEVTESATISAFGADSEDIFGQLWVEGSFTSEIRAGDFLHFLRGVLNPSAIASKALGDEVAKAEASTLPAIDNNIELTKKSPSWPSQLTLALTGSPTLADSGASMKVTGERIIGGGTSYDTVYQEETVELTATGGTTTNFFSKVTGIVVTGLSGGTSPTHTFTYKPATFTTTTTFGTDAGHFAGWTAMFLRGGVPEIVRDLVPTTMALSAGTDGISAEVSCLGTQLERFRTIDTTPAYALEEADTDYFENVESPVFPGWGGALLFGQNVVKCSSLDIEVNRNYESDVGFDGNRHRVGLTQTANRQVTFNPTTYYRVGESADDDFIDFQKMFVEQAKLPLTFRMISYDSDGRQSRIDIKCPKSQIVSPPQYPVTGPGPIESSLSFKALPGEDNTELTIQTWSGAAHTETSSSSE